MRSLPSRECGLKLDCVNTLYVSDLVTPLAGVWIEIHQAMKDMGFTRVTPLAGVWIEIYTVAGKNLTDDVTPLAGVWIEITTGRGLP